MKKKLLIISVLAIIMVAGISFAGFSAISFAEVLEPECDRLFIETMNELLDYEESGDAQIVSTKDLVYDIYLEPLGYIYLFSVNGEDGYAIIINNAGNYEVSEFYFNADNPYGEREETYVYVSVYIYLIHDGEEFRDISTGTVISDEIIALLAVEAFSSDLEVVTFTTEDIYFTYRSENSYNMVARHPAYTGIEEVTNACVPIAAANIIGFYDRYYTNLIPNFTPGITMGSQYLYKTQDANVNQTILSLYNYMGTNTNGPGTTIAQFVSGILAYCNSKSRLVSLTSCISGGTFNFTAAKQHMEAGKPLMLFLDHYSVMDSTLFANHEFLNIMLSAFCHGMSGFGYKEVTYSLTGGGQRIDKYIAVASGLSEKARGYFNINYNTTIDQVYAVNIY
jgi:hypothetical protein